MAYCPNCSVAVAPLAPTCAKCGADFGAKSAWSPIASARPKSSLWLKVKGGKAAVFGARLAATCGLILGLLMAGSFIVLFGTMSIPVGLANSPVKGFLFAAAVYFLFALHALMECWRRPPYTHLVLFLAAAPFGLPILAPILMLAGLAR